LQGIAVSLGAALLDDGRGELRQVAETLARADLDDHLRLELLARLLAEEPVALILDDFERNLTEGGAAFRDAAVAEYLRHLLGNTRCGCLLLTSRHPLPGMGAHLREIPVSPLSRAESRKLLRRLEGLRAQDPAGLERVLRVIGGHPRMLEFLDGLLRGGVGRLPHVTHKLQETMRAAGLGPEGSLDDMNLEEGIRQALLLGARDVLLEELLDIVRAEGLEEVLLQVCVSNLPVSPAGAAHMLADGPASEGVSFVEPALRRLEQLSLVFRFPDGLAWVHRWTAEGLARGASGAAQRRRANHAGRYRWWRVEHESHALEDAWEAVRNHLAGGDFDAATRIAHACCDALRRFHQSAGIAALAGEVLESLPPDHSGYGAIADEEGQAYLALGFTQRAVERYQGLLQLYQERSQAEPDRADYQRDLSVSYNKVGDLYRALGLGEQARAAYQNSLQIRERLAQAEPDRADYQRDLSVSLVKVALAEGGHLKKKLLTRALSILNELKATGRLAPVDEPMIAAIEDLLRGDD